MENNSNSPGSLHLEDTEVGTKAFSQLIPQTKVGKMEKYVHIFIDDERLANVHFTVMCTAKGFEVDLINHSKNIILVDGNEVKKNKSHQLRDQDVIDLLDKNGKSMVRFTYRAKNNALKRAQPETKLDEDPKGLATSDLLDKFLNNEE